MERVHFSISPICATPSLGGSGAGQVVLPPPPGIHRGGQASPQSCCPSTFTRPPVSVLKLHGQGEASPPDLHRPGSPCWSKPNLPSPHSHNCQQGSPAHTCHGGLHSQPQPGRCPPIPPAGLRRLAHGSDVGWWKQEVANKVVTNKVLSGAVTSPFIFPAASSGGWAGVPSGLHFGRTQVLPPGLPSSGLRLENRRAAPGP